MRLHQRRDLVIGGYTAVGRNFDAILVGGYEGREFKFEAKARAGFTPGVARIGVQAVSRARKLNDVHSPICPSHRAAGGAKD
jgi:hypothetical protein